MNTLLQEQVTRETMFDVQQTNNLVMAEVDTETLSLFDSVEEAQAILVTLLKDNKNKAIQSFVGSVAHLLGITPVDAVECTLKYSEVGLYDVTLHTSGNLTVTPLITLPDNVIEQLAMMGALPPMTIPPLAWTNNNDGGYISVQHSCILGRGNSHEEPQALDVLNTLQAIPWQIDESVLYAFDDGAVEDTQLDADICVSLSGKPLYFMWQFDKRGRMYSKGYQVTPQGSQYRKGMLSFHNKHVCTPAGQKALAIAISDHLGQDKLLWDDRAELGHFVYKVVQGEGHFNMDSVKEPILMTKALNAYSDALEGKATGTLVYRDATASGYQIMAVLSGCITTAKAVNVINTGKRADLYEDIALEMNKHLEECNKVDRDIVKKPIMTHAYNSLSGPKETFNAEQLEVFYEVLADAFPGVNMVMDAINEAWEDVDTHTFNMPDGHHVQLRNHIMEDYAIEVEDGVEFDYTERVYGASGNHRHLVPNIIHAIDAYLVREVIRRCDFEVSHIHDCFCSHPNTIEEVSITYKEVMIEISQTNLLEQILHNLTGRNSKLVRLTDNMHIDMAGATFMLS